MSGTYGDAGPTYADFFGTGGAYGNFAEGDVIVVPPPLSKGWVAYPVGTIITPPTDVTAPSVPTSVAASYDGVATVTITWDASTDDVDGSGMAGYGIYRNGTRIGSTTTALTFTDHPPTGTFTYQVNAVDLAHNTSVLSTATSPITLGFPDTTPPTVPDNVTAVATSDGATISWDASTDPTVAQFILGTSELGSTDVLVPGGGTSGVSTYVIYRNGIAVAFDSASPHTDTVAAAGTYIYQVAAVDVAGNISAKSDPASVTVNFIDQTPPSAPTGVGTTDLGSGNIRVSWTASTDNVAVTSYVVYRDGNPITFASVSPYVDTVGATGTYSYTVAALDAAQNLSAQSSASTISVTVAPPGDTTPPSIPTGVTAVHPSGQTVNVHWNASTDTGGSGLAGYIVYRNGNPINFASTTSFTDTVPNGIYTYTIKAYDNASPANVSAASSGATVQVGTSFTPTGLDTSGTNDVYAGLQAFFDGVMAHPSTAANPNVVNLPANATYRCEGTLTFGGPNRSAQVGHLVVHGNGATIKHTTTGPASGQFAIYGPLVDMSFDHITVRSNQPEPGTAAAAALAASVGISHYAGTSREFNGIYRGGVYEGMYGWRIAGLNTGTQPGCDNIHLDHCDVYNVWSDFWNFESHNRHTNCTLTNSIGHVSGRQGFVPGDVENFTADGLTIERVSRTSIDMEPGTSPNAGVQGLTIQNSTVSYGNLGFISFIVGAVGNDVTFERIQAVKRPAQINFGMHALDGGVARDGLTIIRVNGDADWNNQKALGAQQFDIRNTTNITVQDCDQDFKPAETHYAVRYDQDSTIIDVSGCTGDALIGQSQQYTYVP